jgi:ATP-binding cassette subfamily B protein
VRFENVSFAYDTRVPALRGISFDVSAGQKVAILGAPGSGKTTIVHLIPRFYDVLGGRVTVDDRDVREVSLASLRRNVGLVFQDVFLFSATIHENIAFGARGASRDEVVAAARAAQLHEFIATLPEGYDTRVGERGVSLSGGQRQRLVIARTLLLDPPILVLDDSTSSVDPETELLLQKALNMVMEGRTTFIIAHRLSSVKQADMILVLRDGEIVERGTHQELLSGSGLYRQIYELQLLPQEGSRVE